MNRDGSSQLVLFEGVSPEREAPEGPHIHLDDWGRRTIRRLMIKGEPWWVLSDVASVLGYSRSRNAARILREKHKGAHQLSTPGGPQEVIIINEAGLYILMIKSERPETEPFQDWITDEVLPSIRKHGSYSTRSGRIEKMCRRLRTEDPATVLARQDEIDLNNRIHRWLAEVGFKPIDFVNFHDGIHSHVSGKRPRDMRPELGLRKSQSVLDRMGPTLLSLHSAVKQLAVRYIKDAAADLGRLPPTGTQKQLLANAAESVLSGPLQAMGFEYAPGVKEDDERGRVWDLIRKSIESSN